jgi:uncharacterized membrane protein
MCSAVTGEVSVLVEAAPEVVYGYLADFTRHPEWSRNLEKVWQVSDGELQVGTRFRAREWPPPVSPLRRIGSMIFFILGLAQGSQPYSEAEITALEPGRRIAWVARVPRKSGYFNQAEWDVSVDPEAGGATRVTQRFCYTPGSPAARRMVATLGASQGIAAACAVNLGHLKVVLVGT